MRFGRVRMFMAALVAAAAGSGAAIAIPAVAGFATTVSVLTVGNVSTVGVQTILPAPSSPSANWLVMSDDGSNSIDQVDSDGTVTPETISGSALHNASITPGIGDGSLDYLDDDANLLSLTPGPDGIVAAAVRGTPSISARGMVLGPDGRIYITNNAGAILGCDTTSGTSCDSYGVPATFGDDPQPDAITSAGGLIWFTDDRGDLGSVSTTGSFEGPYGLVSGTPSFSAFFGGMTSAAGQLWLIDSAATAVDSVSPAAPTSLPTVHAVASATATRPDLTSLTTGADGNVWFTDLGDQAVGYVDTTTGTVTEYPLPSGYYLHGSIAPGPAGSDSLVFPLETKTGGSVGAVNLLGEITSPVPAVASPTTTSTTTTTASTPSMAASTPSTTIPNPTTITTAPTVTSAPVVTVAAGRLKLSATAAVSTRRVAAVKLSCAGAATTTCAGKLSLSTRVTTTVREKVRGKTKLLKRTRTVTLASARYRLRGGRAETLSLKLAASGFKLLEAAKGRRLKVAATATATAGTALRTSVTLVGAKPVAKGR